MSQAGGTGTVVVVVVSMTAGGTVVVGVGTVVVVVVSMTAGGTVVVGVGTVVVVVGSGGAVVSGATVVAVVVSGVGSACCATATPAVDNPPGRYGTANASVIENTRSRRRARPLPIGLFRLPVDVATFIVMPPSSHTCSGRSGKRTRLENRNSTLSCSSSAYRPSPSQRASSHTADYRRIGLTISSPWTTGDRGSVQGSKLPPSGRCGG